MSDAQQILSLYEFQPGIYVLAHTSEEAQRLLFERFEGFASIQDLAMKGPAQCYTDPAVVIHWTVQSGTPGGRPSKHHTEAAEALATA